MLPHDFQLSLLRSDISPLSKQLVSHQLIASEGPREQNYRFVHCRAHRWSPLCRCCHAPKSINSVSPTERSDRVLGCSSCSLSSFGTLLSIAQHHLQYPCSRSRRGVARLFLTSPPLLSLFVRTLLLFIALNFSIRHWTAGATTQYDGTSETAFPFVANLPCRSIESLRLSYLGRS